MQEQGTPDLEEQGQRQTTCINTKIWNLRLHPRLHQNFQSVFNMYDLNWKYKNLYSEKKIVIDEKYIENEENFKARKAHS